MKILCKIAYVGTAYCGYQVQPNGVSVQQKLNEAARALFGFECDVVGCSRTDSGVHARGFMATFARRGCQDLPTEIPPELIPKALNAHLPEDISVLTAEWVPDGFHARYDVKYKEYEYLIHNAPSRDPFLLSGAWHVPQKLDLEKMREAAVSLVGKHDFSALRDGGTDTAEEDAVREVKSVSIEKTGDLISFRIAADGFLYHMVRIAAGTLVAVGRGTLSPDEVRLAVLLKDRKKLGATAPACGLYLDTVKY